MHSHHLHRHCFVQLPSHPKHRSSMHLHAAIMGSYPPPKIKTANYTHRKAQVPNVFTLGETCFHVTYVTPLFLKSWVLQLFLVWWNVIDLKVPSGSLPLVSISILDGTDSTSLLKVKVASPISMPNELVWAFPACSQCSLFPWLLHPHHCLPCNQALKQVLTFPGSIGLSLLLLCLLHIEQDIFMDVCNKLHLLYKVCCSNF